MKSARYPSEKLGRRSLVASTYILALLAGPAWLAGSPAVAAASGNYGAAVVHYQPGSNASPGYDQPSAALGEPSRLTPGEFGGPVDPFSSPWQPGQLVSIGTGGSLTLRFGQPVQNLATHPYGLDFQIFGSAAFLIINGDFTGGGITDGSLFGANSGSTRVSISADGTAFFALDPLRAPIVDGLFPTDGSGDFSVPVNPSLNADAFANQGLAGIRALYDGAGGGMGYDIGWARDGQGAAVSLDSIEYVRIEVLSGRSEVDAISSVAAIPEATTTTLLLLGGGILSFRRRVR